MSVALMAASRTRPTAPTGPVQYRGLFSSVSDESGRYTLAERVSDGEPFVIVLPADSHGEPVDVINARNVERARLDHALRAEADSESVADDDDTVSARAERVDALKAERSALPRVDALKSGPVARCLALTDAAAE